MQATCYYTDIPQAVLNPAVPRMTKPPVSPSGDAANGAHPAGTNASAPVRMSVDERRATAGLAAIFGLRMLGMFIVLPVLALYAEALPGGNDHALVGLALGAYGLTQAVLQIPFGWASDRLGRKPVIVVGLVIFAAGSFVAAWSPTIGWTIVGRALQGAGAVSAAVLALTADLTRDAVRSRAMAVIGLTIGGTFALSMVAGPALTAVIGVPGVFAMTGALALAAIALLHVAVPQPANAGRDAPSQWRRVFGDGQLLRLNYGIFALHAALLALFVQVPFMLRDDGLDPSRHWIVYLPVLALSAVLMWPALRQADRPRRGKPVFVGAVAVLVVGQGMLAIAGHSLVAAIAALIVFFTAFNLLEATLPSLISKFAPPEVKGTATGVYSAVQFLGTFVGAAAGGWLSQHYGAAAVFAFCIVLTALWLAVSTSMSAPPTYSNAPYSMGGI